MSEKVIVYKTTEGSLAIIHPTQEALAIYGIDAIAQKDVPAGRAYAIIDKADIPVDRTFRAAWDIDDEALIDGVGAESSTFSEVQ